MAIPLELAETVREACLCTLFQAYESAGVSGLRSAGRWEIAQCRRCEAGISDRWSPDSSEIRGMSPEPTPGWTRVLAPHDRLSNGSAVCPAPPFRRRPDPPRFRE